MSPYGEYYRCFEEYGPYGPFLGYLHIPSWCPLEEDNV